MLVDLEFSFEIFNAVLVEEYFTFTVYLDILSPHIGYLELNVSYFYKNSMIRLFGYRESMLVPGLAFDKAS